MRIDAIYISPVKSLALQRLERAHLGRDGIAEDRRFFLIDANERVFTQREYGALVQVRSAYHASPGRLRIDFPDGTATEGEPASGAGVEGNFYGDPIPGELAPGPWDAAFSDFAGQPLRLARATGTAFDTLPISICSAASVDEVRRHADAGAAIDERRFRPNLYITGVDAHGEDAWVGRRVRIGADAVVHVHMRDPRCVITTHSPDTGDTDINTLKIIAAYRTDQPKEVNFGVYGTVEHEGDVAVGDVITPLEEPRP
ncbi:MAG: MOSC domain-containing protein [Chloroflexota bacterium]|nr:MOSC domain-containing protein [Chloroflexota bacterium]